MIKSLQVLTSLSAIAELSSLDDMPIEVQPTQAQPADNPLVGDQAAQIDTLNRTVGLLRDRLREVNQRAQVLLRQQILAEDGTASEVDSVVTALRDELKSLPPREALAYANRNFTPDAFVLLDQQSLKIGKSIREVLREFCAANGLPLTYEKVWGDV